MSDDNDSQQGQAGVPNIEELLAAMAPASTPGEAFGFAPGIDDLLRPLDPLKTVDILAGLMADARFQANHIRLDFALRLVLALAQGGRRPKPHEISNLLNSQLSEGRVTRLEDPIEDFFVESLPTRDGEFPNSVRQLGKSGNTY